MIGALLDRLRLSHANHKRIATGAVWIGLFVLAAKLCAAGREVAIAWRYGISAEVDAYQIALAITTWLPMTLSGVAALVLVPRLVALNRSGGDPRFIGELNGAALLVGVMLTLLTWAGAPFATDLVSATLPGPTRRLAESLAVQMSPIALLIVVGGYFSARLQAREHYMYSFTDAAPPLAIALLVLLAPSPAAAAPLLYGTLLGYLIYAVWLGRMTAVADRPIGGIRVRHGSGQWPLIYGSLLTMGAGQFLLNATLPVDQAFAATLGEGAVSTLGYVSRITTLITTFGFVVFARALLPVLSGTVAAGDLELGRSQALKWAWVMAVLAAVGTVIGWLLAPLGVKILFERGAFSGEDTAVVSGVLRYALLQLPPFFAGIVLVQYYAATSRFRTILGINFLALLAKAAINALLIGPMGLSGIAVSTAAMYTLTALLMALGLANRGRVG